MDEQKIRLACVGHAADVVSRVGGGDVVKTAREIEEFVTGKSQSTDEITDAMIQNGIAALDHAARRYGSEGATRDTVIDVYRAMRAAAR